MESGWKELICTGRAPTQGMTDEECIKAGAYVFRDRLMIGGCMKTFSRRDSLKRHVDNPKSPCVGHMDSYSSWTSEQSVDLG